MKKTFIHVFAGTGWILLLFEIFYGVGFVMVHRYTGLLDSFFLLFYMGIAATFILHIPALVYLFRAFQKTNQLLRPHWMIIGIGVLSLMAPILEWASLGDIAYDIKNGLPSFLDDSGIYLAATVHILFITLLLRYMYISEPEKDEEPSFKKRVDDTIFKIIHGIGIMSGALGLLFGCVQIFFPMPPRNRSIVAAVYYSTLFIPYAISLIIWGTTLRKAKIHMDEKQRIDIFTGSFYAFIVILSIGLLTYITGFFAPQFSQKIQWYPLLLFSGLFTFSLSVFRKSIMS